MSKPCPECGENMTRFEVDGAETWKCLNIKLHDAPVKRRMRSGGARKGAGRKKKKSEET